MKPLRPTKSKALRPAKTASGSPSRAVAGGQRQSGGTLLAGRRFNSGEFATIKSLAGLNSHKLTAKAVVLTS